MFFVFHIALIPVSYAGTGEFNEIWLLTRDHILDGVLDPTKEKDEVELAMRLNSHHNKLSGEYTEIKNDSVFTGETYTARGTTLIVLFQYGRKFYAIHNGLKVGAGAINCGGVARNDVYLTPLIIDQINKNPMYL